MNPFLVRKLAGEFLGTLFLLAIVVGSGIMGDRLSAGNSGIALLANSIATGFGLVVLILVFGPISGAHFNPIVTFLSFLQRHHTKKESALYVLMQISGAIAGVVVAHLMFGESFVTLSSKDRSGFHLIFSEFVATFGLVMVIRGLSQQHNEKIPFAVGAYIASAYWFTASTSFANPAVTLARTLTPTFTGIAQGNMLGFILAQLAGGLTAEFVFRWFFRSPK
jgi:glycerol uptake facilitator-like aquaporin